MSLPSYDELPVRPDLPPRSSWGVWGDDDVFGCLNLLTADRVRAGVETIRDHTVFPLNLELEQPSPPLFGRAAIEHHVEWLGGDAHVGHDDRLDGFNPQSSSQWDGFRHIRHPRHGFYGGVADEAHGVHHWARRGIVGRAVVCDVETQRVRDGRPLDFTTSDPITADDVRRTLDAQHVEVETGDILLVHTGWLAWYRTLDSAARGALAEPHALRAPGLLASEDTLRFLWDLHIAALACDNPAVEVWPPGHDLTDADRAKIAEDRTWIADRPVFIHLRLLPLLGLPLGELWDLTALAAACRADARWTCLLVSAPLNLEAGVASPPNAIAVR